MASVTEMNSPANVASADAFEQYECWPDGFDFPDRIPPSFATLLESVEHEAFCYRSWGTPHGDLLAEVVEGLAARIRAVDACDVETFRDREDGVLAALGRGGVS